MGRARALAGPLAAGLLVAACAAPAPPGDAGHIDAGLVADLDDADARDVAEAVNAFGFDLVGELTDADPDDTVIVSPLSVAVLLAMVLAGAGGETAEAIAEVLHLDAARDVRVGALLGALADTDEVALSVANALWANEGTPLEDDYRAFVQDTFGATIDEADLGARETAEDIDAWVDERTEGLIDEIAEDLGLPDARALLVLVNAVHFLGQWANPFDPDETRDAPFTRADGSQVDVALMQQHDESYAYTERDGYRMLRLPYGDAERYGMEVLLPDEAGSLTAVLDGLDADEWRAATDDLAEHDLDEVGLPRFELEWDAELNDALTELGMGEAFGGGADFRPMSAADPWLDVVVHKTAIDVDEEGTEAAAVTGGVMVESAPVDPLTFVVDRPFVFTISDRDTGTILFLGAVTDPRG